MIDLALILGLISAIGWFFCLGHLISRWIQSDQSWAMILALSCSAIIGFLTLVTPWIPLPPPILLIGGLVLLTYWITCRYPLPEIKVPRLNMIFLATLILFMIYAYAAIAYLDFSFDSLSYHLPFVHEMATLGNIPFPDSFNNWTDYVHIIFPKGVESLYGLALQLHPSFFPFLQILMLGGLVFLVNDLGRRLGNQIEWLPSSLVLGLNYFFNIFKAFWVEFTLFFFVCALFILLQEKSIRPRIAWGIGLITLALVASKTHAIAYVGMFALVLGIVYREWRTTFFMGIGTIIGLWTTYGVAWLGGFDIFHLFKVVQALTHADPTPVADRLHIIGIVIGRILSYPLILVSFIGGIIGFISCPSVRKTGMVWGAGVIAFVGVFVVTSVYAYTYLQLQVYIFAIIGIIAILAAVGYSQLSSHIEGKYRVFGSMVLGAGLIIGIVFTGISFASLGMGWHVGTGTAYPFIHDAIPNDPSTTLFFMNNINSVTWGLEKARVVDFTRYPSIQEKDPCTFFRGEGITHVIYWAQGQNMHQVYGGKDEFYLNALTDLKNEKCSTTLYDEGKNLTPFIAKIKSI
ncbi:MAG: hypothetical protein V1776_01450 [Candidatus Diapherotrites archaeon]